MIFILWKDKKNLGFNLSQIIPEKHYARKNLGYLIAIQKGANTIIETDDDNYPFDDFWNPRQVHVEGYLLEDKDWVNVYKYFTEMHTWPRGFALEKLQNALPELVAKSTVLCPIQQGLADEDPDVDAIYRLAMPLPIKFNQRESIALGKGSICPFNSQNTTWFKEAFPLLYLPSYCSWRLTDIWRSFIAQRIAWECDWNLLFHSATVWQERNEHDFMMDFKEEIPGYTNNLELVERLNHLKLKKGVEHIAENMTQCYELFIQMRLIEPKEMELLQAWFKDIENINS